MRPAEGSHPQSHDRELPCAHRRPGTGKTTTVNAILQLLEDQAERVALCAPTGARLNG